MDQTTLYDKTDTLYTLLGSLTIDELETFELEPAFVLSLRADLSNLLEDLKP